MTATHEDAETARVLAANQALYDAFNTRDAEAIASLWADGVPVACIHPGWAAVRGREHVLATWNAILANPDQPRIIVGAAEVHVVGDSAWVLCRELVSGSPLAATNLFTRQHDRWRLVHHHSSPVSFLAEDLQ
ncbi:MAG: nuclear transport factor 2 family protein [Dehalococcoidia bacterium]|nr:nuclear transport factor 2 family protein [Dehalococcoidia bacterium]